MKRRALIVCIEEYEQEALRKLPGTREDERASEGTLRRLGFDVSTLSTQGTLTKKALMEGAKAFIASLQADAEQHLQPTAFIVVSCHAKLTNEQYLQLLASDSQEGDTDVITLEELLLEPLNGIVAVDDGQGLDSILVLDTCRSSRTHRTWKGPKEEDSSLVAKSPPFLKNLKNHFYMIYSCDPGSISHDTPDGGHVIQEVMRLLRSPPPRKITETLHEAAANVGKEPWNKQRPWVTTRDGENPPLLGMDGVVEAGSGTTRGAALGSSREDHSLEMERPLVGGGRQLRSKYGFRCLSCLRGSRAVVSLVAVVFSLVVIVIVCWTQAPAAPALPLPAMTPTNKSTAAPTTSTTTPTTTTGMRGASTTTATLRRCTEEEMDHQAEEDFKARHVGKDYLSFAGNQAPYYGMAWDLEANLCVLSQENEIAKAIQVAKAGMLKLLVIKNLIGCPAQCLCFRRGLTKLPQGCFSDDFRIPSEADVSHASMAGRQILSAMRQMMGLPSNMK